MSTLSLAALCTGALIALYAALVAALAVAGRHTQARALAGFVPDCAVLFKRLLGDPRVPRRSKAALAAVALYLASPLDLVPDMIPVAGALDDAILAGIALRSVIRGAGEDVVREHWPGPGPSLALLLRLAR